MLAHTKPLQSAYTRLIFIPAVLALLLCLPGTAPAGQQKLLNNALQYFKSVKSSPAKAKRRDMWLGSHDRFAQVLKAGPRTGYAPKALYYMGRCYEEMAMRSWLRGDAKKSVDYFQRAVNSFPKGHSWIDDCLYRKAKLTFYRLGDGRRAAQDLRLILSKYHKGDFAPDARKLLAKITGKRSPAPKKKRAVETTRRTKKLPASKASGMYLKTVRDFKQLIKKKAPTRDSFLTIANRFQRIFEASPRSQLGARAQYYLGFTYRELGRHSGRKSDFKKSATHYKKAYSLFSPNDSWRDDALFHKGEVTYKHLRDEDQAYADLLVLTRDYPKGDMYSRAKKLLRSMDEARAGELPSGQAKGAAPEATAKAGFTAPAGSAQLLGIRHSSGKDFTRIVFDLDGPVDFKERSLPPNPKAGKSPRMFIDLAQTRIAQGVRHRVKIDRGFLKSVRAGQNTTDTARVVLDFTEMQDYHILTLENPYRIVVDVFARKSVAKEKARQKKAIATKKAIKRKPGRLQKKTARDVLAQLGMTIRTVMIDAGHGGRDPGALEYVHYRDKKGRLKRTIRTKEKDITLRAARTLGKTLEARGYHVMYTRNIDKKIPLEDRVLRANIKQADLFISLHCNANNSSKVRGFETYYLGKARNSVVLRLAAKENNVDPMKVSDTQKIVLDLVHSFKIKESKSLAKLVQKQSVKTLRKRYSHVNDHGARSAPFFVLIGAKMPAVLVEMGYITHHDEAKRLRSDKYLQTVSKGIADGIDAYRTQLQAAAP